MRRILLTGKNGQIGWELQRTLAPLGELVALDRRDMDLADLDAIRRVIRDVRPMLIVNAAAYTAVDQAEAEADLAMAINGVAPGVMAEEARNVGAAIIHYSTDYVFDGMNKRAYAEDDPPCPINVYGKTKLAGERMIQDVGVPHLIFRTSWLYGWRRANFLLTLLQLVRERKQLTVVKDQIGAPTWCRTLAEATAQVLAQCTKPHANWIPVIAERSGVYHFTASGEASRYAFAQAVFRYVSQPPVIGEFYKEQLPELKPGRLKEFAAPAPRPKNCVLSNRKIQTVFGITSPHWETTLSLCIDDLRASQGSDFSLHHVAATAKDRLSRTSTLGCRNIQDGDNMNDKLRKSIHLFVPKYRVDECVAGISECLETGWTGLGFKTIAFEDAWKGYTGLPYAHFINSNTAGLHLALEVLKLQRGWRDQDEVVTTPLTFVSTNHAILHARLRPVFADVDNSLCLDPTDVASKLTSRTRAVMFVGLGGNTGSYEEIVKLCREKGLALVLDAAHMAGTRLHGKHVGHDADVAVFSYHAVKNLPTADSGMFCFANEAGDHLARKLTWLGINKDTYTRTLEQGRYKWRYDVDEVGFKYHGNSIMAAIGLVQLRYLDSDNTYRRELAGLYKSRLADHSKIRLIPVADGCESATHLFQARVRNRDDLMLILNENNVYPGVHYRDNTEYRMYHYAEGTCRNARHASQELISLPLHLGLVKEDVDYVCDLLIKHAE